MRKHLAGEKEIQARAQELIELKETIKKLLIKEKELKAELLPSIKEHGAITLDFGRVYYASLKGAETFSRKSVL